MTKKFRDYLRSVEFALITCPELLGSIDRQGDARLYLFTRIDSVLTYLKAGASATDAAAMMARTYHRDADKGQYWWR